MPFVARTITKNGEIVQVSSQLKYQLLKAKGWVDTTPTMGADIDHETPTGGTGGTPVSDAAIVALLNDNSSATYAKVVALIAARTGFGAGA